MGSSYPFHAPWKVTQISKETSQGARHSEETLPSSPKTPVPFAEKRRWRGSELHFGGHSLGGPALSCITHPSPPSTPSQESAIFWTRVSAPSFQARGSWKSPGPSWGAAGNVVLTRLSTTNFLNNSHMPGGETGSCPSRAAHWGRQEGRGRQDPSAVRKPLDTFTSLS